MREFDLKGCFGIGSAAIVVIGIILGITVAVLFALGLIGVAALLAVLPTVITISLVAIGALIALLIACECCGHKSCACVCRFGLVIFVGALVAIIGAIVALVAGLVVGSALSAFLIFAIAAGFFAAVLGLGALIKCVLCIFCCKKKRECRCEEEEEEESSCSCSC